MYQSQVVTGLYIDWVTYKIKVFCIKIQHQAICLKKILLMHSLESKVISTEGFGPFQNWKDWHNSIRYVSVSSGDRTLPVYSSTGR